MKLAKVDRANSDDRFEFGRNWASYSRLIDEAKIAGAIEGLARLIPPEDLKGRSFLDIGSGSGLHALAAARLGVGKIVAVDVDSNSTETTRETLSRHAGTVTWSAETRSIFDVTPQNCGQFDVVYSWGVLHHTGDMLRAVDCAASLVAPGGLFAFALYRRTRFDRFWVLEKRWYARASPGSQRLAQQVFTVGYRIAARLMGRKATVARGMEYWHDLHDWLGGYPYESILADEVEAIMQRLGFEKVRVFARPKQLGLFGSGCDEYVYRRRT